MCTATLVDLSWKLSNSAILVSAKRVEAIRKVQVKHILPATARLDQGTMEAMKCWEGTVGT